MRFSIRDLMALTLCISVAIAWSLDHKVGETKRNAAARQSKLREEFLMSKLSKLERDAAKIEVVPDVTVPCGASISHLKQVKNRQPKKCEDHIRALRLNK